MNLRSPLRARLLTAMLALGWLIFGLASGLRGETREQLLREFSPKLSIALSRPFVGNLKIIFCTQSMGLEQVEPLELGILSPPENPLSSANRAIVAPHLSPMLSVHGTDPGYALRAEWPSAQELTEFTQASNYAALVKLLGKPIHVSNGVSIVNTGEGKGAFHRVWWKFFRPMDSDTIEILDLTVDRVGRFHNNTMDTKDVENVTITGLQIRLGTLKREK